MSQTGRLGHSCNSSSDTVTSDVGSTPRQKHTSLPSPTANFTVWRKKLVTLVHFLVVSASDIDYSKLLHDTFQDPSRVQTYCVDGLTHKNTNIGLAFIDNNAAMLCI